MPDFNPPKSPKEADVFNRFSNLNKLKTILIASAIAIVSFCILFFFAKTLMSYTISIETYGGLVYGEEYTPEKYYFLQKTVAPKGLKKEGYYIEGFYKDKNMTQRYEFGRAIWGNLTLYVNWKDGYALQLNYAENEENNINITEDYVKTYYEQYVKPGSRYTLPEIYNDITYLKEEGKVNHEGEQLLWYEDEDCSGDPIDVKTYVVDKNIPLYGKWFDTKEEKFDISDDGVLNRYLGYCNRIILPSSVKKIKSIDSTEFKTGTSDQLFDSDGTKHSAFQNVMSTLEIVYINAECEEVGDCAFRDCDKLSKITFLGENVTTIGAWAFNACRQFDTIDIPSSVTLIGDSAFYQAEKLKFVTGGENVTRIGANAFMNTYVHDLDFMNVTSLGAKAFSSCYNLSTLTLRSETMVVADVQIVTGTVNDNVLYLSNTTKIYVPAGLVDTYKNSETWAPYASIIYAIA